MHTSRDVLAILRRRNPVALSDVAGTADSPEASALLERILATSPATTAANVSPRTSRQWASRVAMPRRSVLVAATVVGLVAVAAFVPATLLPDERLGASPAAAETLQRLAAVAAAQPETLGGYQYSTAQTLYLATESSSDPFSVLIRRNRESWIASDGSGRIRETGGRPTFLSDTDRERWVRNGGWIDERPVSDERFGPRDNYRDDANLPTDVAELEAALQVRVATENPEPADGYTATGEMLEQIRSLLHSPAVSSELRASLFRVMARLDGVDLIGEVVDPIGRHGVAISGPAFYNDGETARRRLILDPRTSAVLADQTILRKRVDWIDAQPPFVIEEIVYLDSARVDSLDERPHR